MPNVAAKNTANLILPKNKCEVMALAPLLLQL